jgi:hypothetical protein
MRGIICIFLLLFSVSAFGQGVTKERLIGFSFYQNNERSDSASFIYPDKHTANSTQGTFIQGVYQYKDITFNERVSYDEQNQEKNKTRFIKNDNTVEMKITSPDGLIIVKSDYLKFKKGTEKVIQRRVRNYNEEKKEIKDNFNRTVNYNNDNLPIFDSMSWDFGDLGFSNETIKSFYHQGEKIYSITIRLNSFSTTSTDITIDSFLGDTRIRYYYTVTNHTDTSDQTKRTIKTNKDGRTVLNIYESQEVPSWDTLTYEEFEYYETYNDKNLLIERTTNKKTSLNAPFLKFSKIVRGYNEHNSYVSEEQYTADSSNNWKLLRTISASYNDHNKLIKNEIIYPNSEEYQLTRYTYNDRGNLIFQDFEQIGLNESSLNQRLYYYYEPYLEKEINLNYSQLVPIAYPNPFKTGTNILFSCVPNKAGNITIYNSEGQIIDNHSFNPASEIYQYRWDAVGQPKGIYFARIIMGKEIKTIKLIKK